MLLFFNHRESNPGHGVSRLYKISLRCCQAQAGEEKLCTSTSTRVQNHAEICGVFCLFLPNPLSAEEPDNGLARNQNGRVLSWQAHYSYYRVTALWTDSLFVKQLNHGRMQLSLITNASGTVRDGTGVVFFVLAMNQALNRVPRPATGGKMRHSLQRRNNARNGTLECTCTLVLGFIVCTKSRPTKCECIVRNDVLLLAQRSQSGCSEMRIVCSSSHFITLRRAFDPMKSISSSGWAVSVTRISDYLICKCRPNEELALPARRSGLRAGEGQVTESLSGTCFSALFHRSSPPRMPGCMLCLFHC